jgi:hypothetical protein
VRLGAVITYTYSEYVEEALNSKEARLKKK